MEKAVAPPPVHAPLPQAVPPAPPALPSPPNSCGKGGSSVGVNGSFVGYDVVALIHEHQAGVWRYLRSLGCEASFADDLTQETFLSVLEKSFEYQGEAATGAYLRRVAHNLYVTAQRRNARVRYVDDWETFEAAWENWVGDGRGETLLAALGDCLSHLTPRARWALEMRFREKRSRAGIAKALEITEHGAKNLMQRAKKQLRDCVDVKMVAEDA